MELSYTPSWLYGGGSKNRPDYVVDVEIETDFLTLSDDLTKTVDYVAVNKIVTEEMAIRSKLIEHECKELYINWLIIIQKFFSKVVYG